jgi:hypothetical protein
MKAERAALASRTAMAEPALAEIVRSLDRPRRPALVQLTDAAYAR